ncbi:unnamed protein product [Polarella glacialis]|uniref:Uncharacterized protein n=1 Tax=Polarella glacialis TaxID=89957 RepID=A0A813J5G3_POLGL|nr:unnamed protein product [Polarella glacialis]CAE8719748.1 unnamed protein product [Polarella glacialis]
MKKKDSGIGDLLSIKFLDEEEIFEKIGFREILTAEQKVRLAKARPEGTLVFVPTTRVDFEKLAHEVKEFYADLDGYAYMVPTVDCAAIFVIFHYPVPDDLMIKIFADAKERVGPENVISVPEFYTAGRIVEVRRHELVTAQPKYCQQSDEDGELASSTQPELQQSDEDGEPAPSTQPDLDDTPWLVAGKQDALKANRRVEKKISAQRHRSKMAGTARCAWREFCRDGDCIFIHTDEEMVFFDSHSGASPLRLLKTKDCKTPVKCASERLGKQKALWKVCNFRHAGEPALCKQCLGTPCIGSKCGKDFERAMMRHEDAKYEDLQQRNYIQKK